MHGSNLPYDALSPMSSPEDPPEVRSFRSAPRIRIQIEAISDWLVKNNLEIGPEVVLEGASYEYQTTSET